MNEYNSKTVNRFKIFPILRWLDKHTNRPIRTDAAEARAVATLFFPFVFFTPEYGVLHKDSLLLNQAKQVHGLPSIRPSTGKRLQLKSFQEERYSRWNTNKHHDYPLDVDITIRPIIAKLYKAGFIGNAYLSGWETAGTAMVSKGPSGVRDLYLDLRNIEHCVTFPSQDSASSVQRTPHAICSQP